MTIDQYIASLDAKTAKLKTGEALGRAATGVHAAMTVRIFENGENANGGKIGSYDSKNELWANPDKLPKSPAPRSKPGSNRKAKKTVYYSSYKALRDGMGRESGFVNLRLNNDLQSDFANSSVSASSDELAKPTPKKVDSNTFIVALNRSENIEKKNGLEKKYGKIFATTKQEKELFKTSLEKELALIYA